MAASRDPDVAATNTSGVRLDLFCYPESASDVYANTNYYYNLYYYNLYYYYKCYCYNCGTTGSSL